MKKFIIVYVVDVPKNVPSHAKLFIEHTKSDDDYELFCVTFAYNDGTLNDGSRKVRVGYILCSVYSSKKKFKKGLDITKKNYGEEDFNKLYFVAVKGIINTFLVELAVRKVLVTNFKFKDFYDGTPFATLLDVKKF